MSDPDSLVFIDTNIFLDFYRATGSADFKLLNRLKRIQAKIITSHQVEMEFQKNRQKRLSDSFDKLKLKLASLLEIPGLFVGTTKLEELNTSRSQFEKSLNVLRSSLSAAIRNPGSDDPVYKAAKDIFSFKSHFNLTRTNPEYYRIGRLARRRFLFGYPPRKDRDTSIGDAVNWEWIVECAKKSGRSIIIVSRDSDYGLQFARESFLNEWLRQEFFERVGHTRHITLTESLSTALKQIKVHVTPAEEKAEEKLIEAASASSILPLWTDQLKAEESKFYKLFRRFDEQIRARAAEVPEGQQRGLDEENTKSAKPRVEPKD